MCPNLVLNANTLAQCGSSMADGYNKHGSSSLTHVLQVARLAGIDADIVAKARLAGQHIEDKLQVLDAGYAFYHDSVAYVLPAWYAMMCAQPECCRSPSTASRLYWAYMHLHTYTDLHTLHELVHKTCFGIFARCRLGPSERDCC